MDHLKDLIFFINPRVFWDCMTFYLLEILSHLVLLSFVAKNPCEFSARQQVTTRQAACPLLCGLQV